MTRATRFAVAFAAVAAIAAAAAGPSAANENTLRYVCDPPQPEPREASCATWHTRPVKLVWSWDSGVYEQAPLQGSDCSTPHVFSDDTAGTVVMCQVWNLADHSDIDLDEVTIRIDQTAPTVTGFTADRPADHDGWWNHPVSLQFTGTDATSGIAGCDVVSYAGPDGPSAPVTGGCRDVAANATTGTFPIQYDATPPTVAALPATTEVGQTTLNWTTSADAVQTRIVRSPGIGTAAASEVYSGPDHTFTDTGVTGGRAYTYSLSASDPAANAATTSIDVTAKPAPQASPASQQRPGAPPRLRWRRVKGADYYNVQLYRGDRKILSVWPHRNRLQLRRSWTFRGKKRVLAAGSYHWYVWPGFGRRSNRRYGKLIAHRRFKIAPAQAARLR
jgi:hypothetical protein